MNTLFVSSLEKLVHVDNLCLQYGKKNVSNKMLVNISYVRRLSISVIVTGQVVLTHVHITCRLANGYTDIQTD